MTDVSFVISNTVASQAVLSQTYTAWLTGEINTMGENFAYAAFTDGASITEALAIKQAITDGSFSFSNLFTAAQSKAGVIGDVAGTPDPSISVTYTVDGVTYSKSFDLADFMGDTTAVSNWADKGAKGAVTYHAREFLTDVDHSLPADYDPNWANPVVNHAPVAEDFAFGPLTETAANTDGSKATGDFTVSIDLDTLVSDDDGDSLSISVDVDALPAGITYDATTHVLTIDQNSAAFDDLLKGESSGVINIPYTVTDAGGLSDVGEISFEITGTADKYSDSATYTFKKTGGDTTEAAVTTGLPEGAESLSVAERSFVLDLGIEDGFDFGGTLTLKAHADLNAKNESLTVLVDSNTVWSVTGTDSNSSSTETLADYTKVVTLTDASLSDGSIVVDGEFSQQVANGSTLQVQLDYSYWA